jgi:hypothetical protein
MSRKNTIIHFTLFTCIILIAFIVRIYNIDTVPGGIYPDEANNGTNAYDAQLTDDYLWFYPDNNGREGLYINIMAIIFKVFGVSMLTFKLTSIVMGTLTVVGIYFLSRELFISQPRIAIIASYLSAVSFWAINFSRIAFRAIMMLPILTFSFYFIFRGIRTQKLYYFALAGFIFGLGFHSYIAFRIAPALLCCLLVFFIIQNGLQFIRDQWRSMMIFILFAFISALPMFLTYAAHPEYLGTRTNDVSIFAHSDDPLIETIGKTTTLSLMKFNFFGDQNWRHGFPPHPTLDPFADVMFFCGIIASLFIFIFFIIQRYNHKVRNRKIVVHGLLISWFVGFLAPEFLTTEGLPHSLRSIGVLPVVYIFAAYFINFILERAHKFSYRTFAITSALMILLLITSGFISIAKYHILWAYAPQQTQAFNKDLTDIARHIHDLPHDTPIIVIAGALERLPIRLLNTDRPQIIYLYHDQIDQIDYSQKPLIFISHLPDTLLHDMSEYANLSVHDIHDAFDNTYHIISILDF